MNSTLILSRHLFQRALASKIFYLCLLLLCLSGSCSAQNLSKEPEKINLQEITSLSIQLNKKIIQASSLQDQIFPMLISSKINKIPEASLQRNPVDLVCVFGIEKNDYYQPSSLHIQIEEIKNLLKHLLPLMSDQDRLAVVLFYNPSYADNLFDVIDTLPISLLPSLTNTTVQNWETILLTIGEKIVKEDMETERAFKAAKKILSQRNETNRTTGVFISTGQREERWHFGVREDQTMQEIESTKEYLGLQDNNWIIQIFEGEPKEQREVFAESLAALRAGVIETKFLLKPEESESLKGVEIQSTYSLFRPSGRWSFEEDGTFNLRSPSLKLGLEEKFFFDLKIPKITQYLPESPAEVRVASYQVVFVLEDGSEVVKNADLTVRIVGEGEKIADEEESKEVVRSFYRKWGEDWMIPTAMNTGRMSSYEKGKGLLKRYQDSLDGSIVKDDEALQNLWITAEKKLIEDEETGINYCW